MPERRVCEGCGREYWWPGARWQHENCAINTGRLTDAINAQAVASRPGEDETKTAVVEAVSLRTPNRRSRKAYNAYMRDYMRKRRAQ